MILVETLRCKDERYIKSTLMDFFRDKKPWKNDLVSTNIVTTLNQCLIVLLFRVPDDFLDPPMPSLPGY
jgi:hypothetical protein